MRRPSRQGLLSYCPRLTSALITGVPDVPPRIALRIRLGSFSNKTHRETDALQCACLFVFLLQMPPGASVATIKTLLLASVVWTCLFATNVYAQDWQRNIDTYFNDIRAGNAPALPHEVRDSSRASNILKSLEHYYNDSTVLVRIKSYELCYYIASQSKNRFIRTSGVELLLSACTSRDALTTGVLLEMLKSFDKNDFSQTAKAEVRQFLQEDVPHLSEWMKLAAFLNLQEFVPRIKAFSQPGNPAALRWDALLSLARLKEAWAIEEIILRVKRLPLDDDLVYRIFPDLIFTRQRAAIDYMVDVLHRDDESCLAADVENEQSIPCGYRVMEQLAPVIDQFPVQVGEDGDIITTNYPAALALVRKWFNKNADYLILQNRF